nr:group II intron reverse transcriptase/maturase [Clostridium perfringens]
MFDKLYFDSLNGKNFTNLMRLITNDNNILLAYRNIKKNKGSMTPGVDKLTIKDIEEINKKEFIETIKRKFNHYIPRKVRRVEIPKPNGKLRPLGIPSIWDRIVQQCILQVIEPICEAKFNKHSYGYRPNRSAEHAIADCVMRINKSHMKYVVDIDIKSFFDEVNHTKLMRQIWSLGIRDKQLLVIIRKILKAPIVLQNREVIYPTKGTPQGGILSPLLANINLNEFDWWITNQWENRECKELKRIYNKTGTWDKANMYRKLRYSTTLKEMYLVRYADDFKIFCNTFNIAKRIFHGAKSWLKERLKLTISQEKSKITNLRRKESEFLGFTLKIEKKSKKDIALTHVCKKAKQRIKLDLKKQLKKIQRNSHYNKMFIEIGIYNSKVVGLHNYYRIATHCNKDFNEISSQLRPSLSMKLKRLNIKKSGKYGKNESYKPYYKSKEMRYISGFPILPIGYIQHMKPMNKRKDINKYTPKGRISIHKNITSIEYWKINWLIENSVINKRATVEFIDNRISKFIAQHGKCGITSRELILNEMHCHHIKPYHKSQDDSYNNLIIITDNIHKLIHATDKEIIEILKNIVKLDETQLKKLNELRKKVGNKPI